MATLVRLFGDIDVAEEAVQEAFAAALRTWPTQGVPPSPTGWIVTTARNRAIDRLRRESVRRERHVQATYLDPGQLTATPWTTAATSQRSWARWTTACGWCSPAATRRWRPRRRWRSRCG